MKTCPSPRASEPVRFRLMGWQGREGSSQSTGPAHARLGGCPKVAHVIVLHNLQGHAQRRLQASQVVQAPHSHGYTERWEQTPPSTRVCGALGGAPRAFSWPAKPRDSPRNVDKQGGKRWVPCGCRRYGEGTPRGGARQQPGRATLRARAATGVTADKQHLPAYATPRLSANNSHQGPPARAAPRRAAHHAAYCWLRFSWG